MSYFLFFILGILPSIIWLLFFLREDAHPESNRMIIKVFSYGIIAAFLAALSEAIFESGFLKLSSKIFFPSVIILFLNVFVGVSLIEEFFKYLVVRTKAISDPEFDEPLDAMLYMIIAGLGFAAVENVLYLFTSGPSFDILETLTLTLFRFLGATFLHALCSGTLGFFLALSFFETKNKFKLVIFGLVIATSLHGIYNFFIIKIGENLETAIPGIILIGFILITLGIFVFLGFKKLKTMASVCKIK